jgi:hypothetical protein
LMVHCGMRNLLRQPQFLLKDIIVDGALRDEESPV